MNIIQHTKHTYLPRSQRGYRRVWEPLAGNSGRHSGRRPSAGESARHSNRSIRGRQFGKTLRSQMRAVSSGGRHARLGTRDRQSQMRGRQFGKTLQSIADARPSIREDTPIDRRCEAVNSGRHSNRSQMRGRQFGKTLQSIADARPSIREDMRGRQLGEDMHYDSCILLSMEIRRLGGYPGLFLIC